MGKIKIETSFNEEEIFQDCYVDAEDSRQHISSEVIRLKDEGVRTALIKMGWIPPENYEHKLNKEEFMEEFFDNISLELQESPHIPFRFIDGDKVAEIVEHRLNWLFERFETELRLAHNDGFRNAKAP